MKVFISYPSVLRRLADQINLALVGQGCEVFFDRTGIAGGTEYNSVVERQIAQSDLMVFLISKESVRERSYTLTELELFRKKWPAPAGRLLPVLVDSIDVESTPPYLGAVSKLEPTGNPPAEVVARVKEMQEELRKQQTPEADAPQTAVNLETARPATAAQQGRITPVQFPPNQISYIQCDTFRHGMAWPITTGDRNVSIGSSAECDIRVHEDELLASYHCRIIVQLRRGERERNVGGWGIFAAVRRKGDRQWFDHSDRVMQIRSSHNLYQQYSSY